MTNNINGIDLSKYFKNHYDSWGRLYCVEYKGDPLELQNAIKRLQKENEELKNKNNDLIEEIASGNIDIAILQKENEELKRLKCKFKEYCTCDIEKYRSALEEIRDITNEYITDCMGSKCEGMEEIQNKINEVLEDSEDDTTINK